jgi:hypothetical protein
MKYGIIFYSEILHLEIYSKEIPRDAKRMMSVIYKYQKPGINIKNCQIGDK